MRVQENDKEVAPAVNRSATCNIGDDQLSDLLIRSDANMFDLSGSIQGFTKRKKRHVRKMGTITTFFAVLKAYCAINILLLPCSFANGGYFLSPCAMFVACFFEGLCAYRLCEVGVAYSISSYPMIAYRALGWKGRALVRCLIGLAHMQFSIGQLTFTLKTLQSVTA